MSRIYLCPHCGTQNFATPARWRKRRSVPLKCWKCAKEISEFRTIQVQRRPLKGGKYGT